MQLIGKRSSLAAVVTLSMLAALLPRACLAQEGQKVAQVVITGNQNVNKETIANVVKLAPGDLYSAEAVDKDRAAINALGYFSAVSVRTEETPEGLRVIYDVVENQIVKEIKIVGAGPIPDKTILDLLRTRPGQVLNTATLSVDIDAIQRQYQDQGYIAYVTEDIGIDKETGVLTIPILVHTVESVDIIGNKKTDENVFLREMKTRKDVVFNRKLLREDIARIFNLDILEDIQSPKIEPGSTIGKLRVIIPVTEKKTGQVSIGLGYSSRSRLVGRAELTETNLRGRGQGLTLLWETGTSTSTVGGTNSYEVAFHEPWIDKKHTSLSVDVFNKLLYRFSSTFIGGAGRIGGQTYNERRKGATLGVSRPLTDYTRAFVTLRGETVDTSEVPTDGTAGVGTFATQSGPVRSGTFKLLNNTRDFDKDPSQGWYRSVSLELGSSDVTERFTLPDNPIVQSASVKGGFQKLQIDVRRYFSLKGGPKVNPTDRRNTIALRLLSGVASGEIPYFEQYFMGGSDTLRGYREDRFWGNRMMLASAEYRRPVTQGLTGVLFLDWGDAWGSKSNIALPGLSQHSGFSPHAAAGLGLRVVTPIGNLRLDYGVGSEGPRTHFSIGHAF